MLSHLKHGRFEIRGVPGNHGPDDVLIQIRIDKGEWLALTSYDQLLMAAFVMDNDRRDGYKRNLLDGFEAVYDHLDDGLEAAIQAGAQAKQSTPIQYPVPLAALEVITETTVTVRALPHPAVEAWRD